MQSFGGGDTFPFDLPGYRTDQQLYVSAKAKENGSFQEKVRANELLARIYLDWGKEKLDGVAEYAADPPPRSASCESCPTCPTKLQPKS